MVGISLGKRWNTTCLGACRQLSQSGRTGRRAPIGPAKMKRPDPSQGGGQASLFSSFFVATWSAPSITVERTVNPGPVPLEADGASLLVALPDVAQRCKLVDFQRRLLACGTEDHADVVIARTVD